MRIELNHIPKFGGKPAKIVEIIVKGFGGDVVFTSQVTDLDGKVEKGIIDNLEEIVGELKEHNKAYNRVNGKVYVDRNGDELEDGDVILLCDNTVNGCNKFYVESLVPLDLRYDHARQMKYEYDIDDLLSEDGLTGESDFIIFKREG